MPQLDHWEPIFSQKIKEFVSADDPAHDLLHFQRVVAMAKKLCQEENGRIEVVVPAAWLHDLVVVPKDSPLRRQASRLSADAAKKFLKQIEYPLDHHDAIAHAIEAHSFSANIEPTTLEAKIVQDADRLDGIGAIGIARCFATAGLLKRPFYFAEDPFCEQREPNDQQFTIDHFYRKLFKAAETLNTLAGRKEGSRRVEVMRNYLNDLSREMSVSGYSSS